MVRQLLDKNSLSPPEIGARRDRPSDCLPSSLTECMQGHLSATSNASRHVDHALVFNLAAVGARLLLLTLAHLRQTIHAVSVDLVKLYYLEKRD